MFSRLTHKGKLGIICTVAALAVCAVVFLCLADVLMPEATGEKVQKDGKLIVDSSNSAEGYIMAKVTEKDKKRMKLRVTMGGSALNYDLNSDGNFEVFPLQFGKVNYTVTLYRNVEGKKYKEVGQVTVSPKGMEDDLRCFLYPNQYVNYDEKTKAVAEAEKLCAGLTGQREIYDAVVKYIKENFKYDYMKSSRVQPGQLPQIGEAWDKKMGICQDLAAITVAMLRSRGVPARLMIGYLGNTYHAWVTAVVDGTEQFFDPTVEIGGARNGMEYTLERYY